MTTAVLILALAAGTVLFKVTGPLLAGGRQPPAALLRVIGLLAPALIAALIVSDTFTSGQQLTIDARVIGLGVGAIALWFKMPPVVALILAAATCAVVRLVA
jgi:hypothetical protein